MEDQTSLLQSSMQEDSFEVVMRGYNKRQVDDYVLQCQHHIRDLAQRLALAEQEAERIRTEAASQLEKASSKPVHEEVSERLAQILRLANEEAERERQVAADEIAALRAQTLAETQALREQARTESEELRRLVNAESDGLRARAKAETDDLRDRVDNEVEDLRQRTEADVAHELERARLEAERVLTSAREAAEQDLAEASARVQDVEEQARSDSERTLMQAQARAAALIDDAERRATAVNTVLGTRLELLTTTHADVVARLLDLRTVLVDALDKEETAGPFAVVPSPAEAAAATARSVMQLEGDPYVETAGEVAAAHEASAQQAVLVATWRDRGEDDVLDVDAVAPAAEHVEAEVPPGPVLPPAPVAEPVAAADPAAGGVPRRLDLRTAAERSRR